MFETLALVLLALAFGVLLWTFVWVAKLLTHRAKVKERAKKKVIAKKEIAEELAGEEEQERGRRARNGSGSRLWGQLWALARRFILWFVLAVAVGCGTVFCRGILQCARNG